VHLIWGQYCPLRRSISTQVACHRRGAARDAATDWEELTQTNPDGVALGVLRAAFDAPALPNPEAEGEPSVKPREDRKSFRWVEGLRDCAQAAEPLSETAWCA